VDFRSLPSKEEDGVGCYTGRRKKFMGQNGAVVDDSFGPVVGGMTVMEAGDLSAGDEGGGNQG
jgi:hypothetical protein